MKPKPSNKQTWEKTFDIDFAPNITEYGAISADLELIEDLKSFISAQIDKAVKEEMKEIEKLITPRVYTDSSLMYDVMIEIEELLSKLSKGRKKIKEG